jgi:hypothetical protein
MTGANQPPLLPGAVAPRVLNFDADTGILYLLAGETEMCPYCRATERQSCECGELDCCEMTCQECGQGYGVSFTEEVKGV